MTKSMSCPAGLLRGRMIRLPMRKPSAAGQPGFDRPSGVNLTFAPTALVVPDANVKFKLH